MNGEDPIRIGSPRGIVHSENSRSTILSTPVSRNSQLKPLDQQLKPAKKEGTFKQGRWTRNEHFRFLEALKLYGKEWKHVQYHVGSRSSTQARSHAQKFFGKLQKKNKTHEQFLLNLDLSNIHKSLINQDLSESGDEDQEEYTPSAEAKAHIREQAMLRERAAGLAQNDQDSKVSGEVLAEKPGQEIQNKVISIGSFRIRGSRTASMEEATMQADQRRLPLQAIAEEQPNPDDDEEYSDNEFPGHAHRPVFTVGKGEGQFPHLHLTSALKPDEGSDQDMKSTELQAPRPKRRASNYLQSQFEESPTKRKKLSSGSASNVSKLFASKVGQPLEDRPETHHMPTNAEKPARKYSSSCRNQDGEPASYKDGFARPVSLNPVAFNQIDPRTKALYRDAPLTTTTNSQRRSQNFRKFQVINGNGRPEIKNSSVRKNSDNSFAEPTKPTLINSTSTVAYETISNQAQIDEEFEVAMRVSQTPRLKATNKSPILETQDAPKRPASQYGFTDNNYDNAAFYTNPGLGELDLLAPGYDQLDDQPIFPDLPDLGGVSVGYADLEDYQRLEQQMQNFSSLQAQPLQQPLGLTRIRSQTFNIGQMSMGGTFFHMLPTQAMDAIEQLKQAQFIQTLGMQLGTQQDMFVPPQFEQRQRNSFDFDDQQLELSHDPHVEERRFSVVPHASDDIIDEHFDSDQDFLNQPDQKMGF